MGKITVPRSHFILPSRIVSINLFTGPATLTGLHIQKPHPVLGRSFAVVARAVPPSSAAPECLDFIRSQLAICEISHDNCNTIEGGGVPMMGPEYIIRIRDVDGRLGVAILERERWMSSELRNPHDMINLHML